MAGREQGLVFFDQLLTGQDLDENLDNSHDVYENDQLDDDASMFSTNTVDSGSEHYIDEDIMSPPDDDNAARAPEGDFENDPFAGDTSPRISPSVLDQDNGNISSHSANRTTKMYTHNNTPFNNTLQPSENLYVTSAYNNDAAAHLPLYHLPDPSQNSDAMEFDASSGGEVGASGAIGNSNGDNHNDAPEGGHISHPKGGQLHTSSSPTTKLCLYHWI